MGHAGQLCTNVLQRKIRTCGNGITGQPDMGQFTVVQSRADGRKGEFSGSLWRQ